MALKKNIDFQGVQIPDAYIKVARVSGNKSKISANIEFKVNQDSETWFKTETRQFDLDLDGPNVIEQAYKYLKTLDEYSGAKDC